MIYTIANKNMGMDSKAGINMFFPVFFIFIIYSIFSQYLLLSLLAGFTLAIIFTLFWKPYLPPALLYFFGVHWLQLFAGLLFADYKGQSMNTLFMGEHTEYVLAMSFLQLTIMSVVASHFFNKNIEGSKFSILKAANQLDTKRIIAGYFIFTAIFPFISAAARSNASLSQLVQSFAVLRYVFPMLLAFILFTRKDKLNGIIIAILIIEFLLGFASFFSSFKIVIFFIGIVYLTVYPSIKFTSVIKLAPIILFLGSFMIFWQAVKKDYREYLNGGTGQQVVTVSQTDALGYLAGRVKTFTSEQYKAGTEELIYRADALKYYYRVYDRVPSIHPYANGQMFKNNLMFLTVPRFLNPNKGFIDASATLSYYTGQKFKGAAEGTAIAMGYFADFYVDFGMLGMFVPLVLIGAFMGWGSNYLLRSKKYNPLFTFSIFIAIVISIGTVENDTLTFLGSIRNFVVLVIVGNWAIFPYLNKKLIS